MKIKIFVLFFLNVFLLYDKVEASLIYQDYLDNDRYKNEANTQINLMGDGMDLVAVKISSDPSPYNSIPTIFLVDSMLKVVMYNYYSSNGKYSIKYYHFNNEMGTKFSVTAFDKNIYVADSQKNEISQFQLVETTWNFIKNNTGFDLGFKEYTSHPIELATDRNGNIYVVYANPQNIMVKVFDNNLITIKTIGKTILNAPRGIAIGTNSYIYISDQKKEGISRIIKFTENGTIEKEILCLEIEELGANAKFDKLDCDIFNNVYVVDSLNNKIYKFNPNLEYIDTCSGGDGKPFQNIRSIAVDKIYNYNGIPGQVASYGEVFVLEAQRVQYFDIGMAIKRITPIKDTFSADNGEHAEIKYTLTEPGHQTVKVYSDATGNLVKILKDNEEVGMAGEQTIIWDGKDTNGNIVTGGNYIIEISASDKYGNISDLTKLCPVTVHTPPKVETCEISSSVFAPGQIMNITYSMDVDCYAFVYIIQKDSDGNETIIRQIANGISVNGGSNYSTLWDGKNLSGDYVEEGEYYVKVWAKDEENFKGAPVLKKIYFIKNPPAISLATPTAIYNGTPYYGKTATFVGSISGYALKSYKVAYEYPVGSGTWMQIIERNITDTISNGILAEWDTGAGTIGIGDDVICNIRITAENMAGQNTELISMIHIDNSMPQINISNIQHQYFSPILGNSILLEHSESEILTSLHIYVKNITDPNLEDETNIIKSLASPINWDGKNSAGNIVADGKYYIVFKGYDKGYNRVLKTVEAIVDTNSLSEVCVTNSHTLQISNNSNIYTPDWYDNKNILYACDLSGENNIYMASFDNDYNITGIRALPTGESVPQNSYDFLPHISLDKKIVFIRDNKIFMQDIMSDPYQFWGNSYVCTTLWDRNGKYLLFSDKVGDLMRILKWDRIHNQTEQIYSKSSTSQKTYIDVRAIYPITEKILYDMDGNIRIINSNGENDQNWKFFAIESDISPDGQRVIFNRSGNLFISYADGSNETQLTFSGSYHYPRWSPDGKKILSEVWIHPYKKAQILDLSISNYLNLTAQIIVPENNATIMGVVDIKGIATDINFDKYSLYYGAGVNPTTWQPIILNQMAPKIKDVLCQWDTTDIITNGTYTIKLIAYDKAGNSKETMVPVYISNAGLISNLTLNKEYINPAKPGGDSVQITYNLLNPWANTIINIVNKAGTVVYQYTNNTNNSWDGYISPSVVAPDGIYTVKIIATSSYGKEQILQKQIIVDTNNFSNIFNLTGGDGYINRRPSWSPDNGKIVYDAFSTGTYYIRKIGVDGNNKQNLKISGMELSDPAWGANNKIAYRYYTQGINIVNENGIDLNMILGNYHSPEWSDDGNLIAFLEDQKIYYANSDGSDIKTVFSGGQISIHNVIWWINNNSFFYAYNNPSGNDIDACYKDGILIPIGLKNAEMPTYNKITHELAYIKNGNIYILKEPYNQSNEKQITVDGGYANPTWSNDGTKIACDKNGDIIILDIKNWQCSDTPIITKPVNNSYVKNGFENIIGTANDVNFKYYFLEYKQQGTTDWQKISDNITVPVIESTLANWDTRTLNDNAPYDLRITMVDSANNITTATITVLLDKTAPQTTITNLNSEYYDITNNKYYCKKDAKFRIAATDNASGVNKIHIILNGVETLYDSSPIDITLSFVGKNTIIYYAEDNAGNIEAQKIKEIYISEEQPDVMIQTTGLYFELDENHKYINNQTLFSISGMPDPIDRIPIDYTEYKIQNLGDWMIYNAPFSYTGNNSEIEIYGKAVNSINNSKIISNVYKLDNNPPISTISLIGKGHITDSSGNIIMSNKSGFIISADDIGCGVQRIEYKKDAGIWINYLTYKIDPNMPPPVALPIYFSDEGQKVLYYRSVDWLNNYESERTINIISDLTPPQTKIYYDGIEIIGGIIFNPSGNLTLTLVATDYVAGVKETYYKINEDNYQLYSGIININAKENIVLTYYSVDNVLNEEIPKTLNLVYSTATPTLTYTTMATLTSTATTTLTCTMTSTLTCTVTETSTPTLTNTFTETISFTATATITPSVLPAYTIILKFKSADSNVSTNSPHPWFRIYNSGSNPIDLTKIEIRYWYRYEGSGQAEQSWVDWAGRMPQGTYLTNLVNINIVNGIFGNNQDKYIKITFREGAGSIAQNEYVEVQTRFNKVDWGNYNQSNDWSFVGYTEYTEWDKVGVYYYGVLIWGVEPIFASPTVTPTITNFISTTFTPTITLTYTITMTPTPGETINIALKFKDADIKASTNSTHPQFRVYNNDTNNLDLSKLEIRYWYKYEGSGQGEQAWVDWAGKMPQGNCISGNTHLNIFTGSFGNNQDRYLKVTFDSGAGSIAQNEYIEVQTRFNKSDWSNYDQSNDWSFAAYTDWTNWDKVTVYYDGTLIWGDVPGMGSSYSKYTIKTFAAEPLSKDNVFNFPNPCQTETIIRFSLEKPQRVKIIIYDINGKIIWNAKLGPENTRRGINYILWKTENDIGRKVPNGVYFYKIITDEIDISKKIIVIR